MAEKSAFNILQESLQELGFEPKTHISGRNFIVPGSYLRFKFILAEVGNAYFFASDSHGNNYSSTFTGLYAPIDLAPEAECSIFRREWFDRLFVSGKVKTGIDHIDKVLTIKSPGWNPITVMDSNKADKFLEMSSHIKPLKLLIRNDYMENLVPLKGKKIIGLETNRWLYFLKDVRTFLEEGKALIDSFL